MRVTAAGPCAGQYYCCYTPAQCAELWETAWRTDLLNALHRDRGVAVALRERGELSGDEVDALIARPGKAAARRTAAQHRLRRAHRGQAWRRAGAAPARR